MSGPIFATLFSLTLLSALAILPLGSSFQSAQAKPKDSAPAYGYRNKRSKAEKRYNKRTRRQYKRDARRDRRNDRNTARPNDRNERYDDNRNNDRDYTPRYRNRTDEAGNVISDYLRSRAR